MRKRRRRLNELLLMAVVLFVLWQLWERVHFVYIARIPWWGLPLLAVLIVVAADLVLSRMLGD